MLEKEDLKQIENIIDKSLDSKLKPIKEDISGLKQGQASLVAGLLGVKEDISGLKQDMSVVKQDVMGLKQGQASLESGLLGLKEEMGSFRNETEENFTYVRGELNDFRTELNQVKGILLDFQGNSGEEHKDMREIRREIKLIEEEVDRIDKRGTEDVPASLRDIEAVKIRVTDVEKRLSAHSI